MSVRMNATLYSEVARIERGDYLRFHCETLSHLQQDVQRYFFGVYYPRWRCFYLEEVREVIGNMGYTQLRHFPAFPLDVYCRETGEPYLTDDFVEGNVLIVGNPQNQRDAEMKRFKIVSVDETTLRTRTGDATSGLPAVRRACQVSTAPLDSLAMTVTARAAGVPSPSPSHPPGGVAAGSGLGASQIAFTLPEDVVQLLTHLRDAYIAHAGGGIPEIGIKAMGRPFRKPAADGRRWMTLPGIERLIADSRLFGTAQPPSMLLTQRSQQMVRDAAEAIFNAFPHGGDDALVAADTLVAAGAATVGSGKAGTVRGGTLNTGRESPTNSGGLVTTIAASYAASAAALPATGGVDYDVFMDAIRGHMSVARKKAVWGVFTKLDFDRDGLIGIRDIQAHFNAHEHPVVVRDGFFTAEGLRKGFLTLWDENTRQYGMVSYAEFLDYYNGLSAVIEDDRVFQGILTTTWNLAGFA